MGVEVAQIAAHFQGVLILRASFENEPQCTPMWRACPAFFAAWNADQTACVSSSVSHLWWNNNKSTYSVPNWASSSLMYQAASVTFIGTCAGASVPQQPHGIPLDTNTLPRPAAFICGASCFAFP
eukprot:Hpha_TRINITY_DN15865_c4_g3::TRINITY_DN15865_c4_g3_i2::g.188441::m.188441